MEILRTLERHYGDMQDTEFTVQEGRLYMLQTRSAKRPAQAAVRFAVDAVAEGLLTREQALMTIDAASLEALLSPMFDPMPRLRHRRDRHSRVAGRCEGDGRLHGGGRRRGEDGGPRGVLLVRPFTDAGDVAGFHGGQGDPHEHGGKASHAALVARGMGRPAVTGAAALKIDLAARRIVLPDGSEVKEGDFLAINGTTGDITRDDVPAHPARGQRGPSDDPRMG